MNHIFPFGLWVGVLLSLASTIAGASAQRTFVSVAGTSNPGCSLVAPCRSFAQAIAATNAGGEIVVLDSGGYGAVTVTKGVSIIAPPGIYAGVSVFSGDGVTINAPGATVVLRGLSINGQGGSIGIEVQAAARVRIESCVVSNMGSHGIYHGASNAEMVVLDTIVRDNQGTGIAMVADLGSTMLDHVRIEHSGNDGFYIAATAGSLGVLATVVDSVSTHNGVNGIWADTIAATTTTITVERTVVSYNGDNGFKGTAAAGSQTATLNANVANDNGGHGIWLFGNLYSVVMRNASSRNGGSAVFADGGAYVVVSANAVVPREGPGSYGLYCNDSAPGTVMRSLQDNAGNNVNGTCYSAAPVGI